jgi:hypothetical protein
MRTGAAVNFLPMSTRMLIAAALVCGLLILVAFTVQVVLWSR